MKFTETTSEKCEGFGLGRLNRCSLGILLEKIGKPRYKYLYCCWTVLKIVGFFFMFLFPFQDGATREYFFQYLPNVIFLASGAPHIVVIYYIIHMYVIPDPCEWILFLFYFITFGNSI
jgi:membrane protein YdbS with pleckstrin-like domain